MPPETVVMKSLIPGGCLVVTTKDYRGWYRTEVVLGDKVLGNPDTDTTLAAAMCSHAAWLKMLCGTNYDAARDTRLVTD